MDPPIQVADIDDFVFEVLATRLMSRHLQVLPQDDLPPFDFADPWIFQDDLMEQSSSVNLFAFQQEKSKNKGTRLSDHLQKVGAQKKVLSSKPSYSSFSSGNNTNNKSSSSALFGAKNRASLDNSQNGIFNNSGLLWSSRTTNTIYTSPSKEKSPFYFDDVDFGDSIQQPPYVPLSSNDHGNLFPFGSFSPQTLLFLFQKQT